MLSFVDFPFNGMTVAVRGDLAFSGAGGVAAAAPALPGEPPHFERLVALYRDNEVLLSELKSLKFKLANARAYLRSPSSNAALGEANFARLRVKHSAVTTVLRANRIQARELLRRFDVSERPGAAPESQSGRD